MRQIKTEHWKSKTNLSWTMNFVTDLANAKSMTKSGTNFMVRDKFVSDFYCSDRFKGF